MTHIIRKSQKWLLCPYFIFFVFFTNANADTITLNTLIYTDITSDWEQGTDGFKLISLARTIGSDSSYTFDPVAAFIIDATPYIDESGNLYRDVSGNPYYTGYFEVRNDIQTDADGNMMVDSDGNLTVDSDAGHMYVHASFNNLTTQFQNFYNLFDILSFAFTGNERLPASGIAVLDQQTTQLEFNATWLESQIGATFSGLITGNGLQAPAISNDTGVTATPEPATFMLFGIGLLCLAGMGRPCRNI